MDVESTLKRGCRIDDKHGCRIDNKNGCRIDVKKGYRMDIKNGCPLDIQKRVKWGYQLDIRLMFAWGKMDILISEEECRFDVHSTLLCLLGCYCVLYVVNNVTERLSVLVAATSAFCCWMLAIVVNGTHPMLPSWANSVVTQLTIEHNPGPW